MFVGTVNSAVHFQQIWCINKFDRLTRYSQVLICNIGIEELRRIKKWWINENSHIMYNVRTLFRCGNMHTIQVSEGQRTPIV